MQYKVMRIILAILSVCFYAVSICAANSTRPSQNFRVEGYITNMLTGSPLTEAITVEILLSDSTVIAFGTSHYSTPNSGARNFFNISAEGVGEEFIVTKLIYVKHVTFAA